MTEAEYREQILSELASVSVKVIARAMNVSEGCAARVRKGEKVPHPRHWTVVAELGGTSD